MQKECQLKEKAILYAFGELPHEEAAGLKDHISKCKVCRAELKILKAAENALPAPLPPERIIDAILKAAAAGRRKEASCFWQRFFVSMPSRALAFSFALLLVISGFFLIASPFPHSRNASLLAGKELGCFDDAFEEDMDMLEAEISSDMEIWENIKIPLEQ